jgi:uncharacterized protein (DUF433 family)
MIMAKNILTQHIEIKPGIAGSKPHIAGHRITVQNVVLWHERLGLSPDEIATDYGLTLGDVYAALAYYHDHRDAIDQSIQDDESFLQELKAKIPSRLREKLRG